MRTRWRSVISFALLLALGSAFAPMSRGAQREADASVLKGLQWRSIGPFRGGRSTAVSGVASQPMVYYFGGTGGGVWKTTDGGIDWTPVSDGFFKTGSVGA